VQPLLKRRWSEKVFSVWEVVQSEVRTTRLGVGSWVRELCASLIVVYKEKLLFQ
jgi:N6-adenosine-specific RNA methylase IME4